MKSRVAVLHGINLGALDRRPAQHYGGLTFTQLEQRIGAFAVELGLQVSFFQTNHEGELVEELHKAPDFADGILLNPGAWTHYAWSLRDEVAGLLAARGLPVRLDPAIGLDAVQEAVGRDKKRRGGRVGFVLVDAPGDVRTGEPVADGALRAALQELRAP